MENYQFDLENVEELEDINSAWYVLFGSTWVLASSGLTAEPSKAVASVAKMAL